MGGTIRKGQHPTDRLFNELDAAMGKDGNTPIVNSICYEVVEDGVEVTGYCDNGYSSELFYVRNKVILRDHLSSFAVKKIYLNKDSIEFGNISTDQEIMRSSLREARLTQKTVN